MTKRVQLSLTSPLHSRDSEEEYRLQLGTDSFMTCTGTVTSHPYSGWVQGGFIR